MSKINNQDKIVAKKHFGQNFLKDSIVLEKIIESMPNSENIVVEIGPGLGDLTNKLLKKRDVVAFEIDRDLCNILKNRFKDEIKEKRLILNCGDVLDFWKSSLIQKPYDLVANLPYYVATNIVLKALRDRNCKNILVMLQKEVAKKFAAQCGDKEFSSLAILARSAGEVKRVFDVNPNSFEPPPKVMSSILFIKKDRNLEDIDFEEFLKAAFLVPRKTLLKNLSKKYDKESIKDIFEKLNLPLNIRPHQVATSIYHQIFKLVKRMRDGSNSTKEKP